MDKPQQNFEFTFSFPAIRGIQAQREYYSTMCPLHLLGTLFKFDDASLSPDHRAQRILNRGRIPEMGQYILNNPDSYIFSSLTASIGGRVHFEPMDDGPINAKLGTLYIPAEAQVLINDGQHRRAAIEYALRENPALKNETISVVIFVDSSLKNSQQMFSDLNRYSIRTTRSLGILYDHRDPLSVLVQDLVEEIPVFQGMTEKAKTTISNRSSKLFTLSSIYSATQKLLGKKKGEEIMAKERIVITDFWTEVTKHMPDWVRAKEKKVVTSELRSTYIHAHGVALQAIAIAGASLLEEKPKAWKRQLSKLKTIDWARDNATLWEGRALIAGRLSKSQNNIVLTANVLKAHLGLPLTEREKELEENYVKGKQ